MQAVAVRAENTPRAMISEKQLPELRVYRRIENLLDVQSAPELHRLVVPSSNDELPVHRWLRFKEGFSADLLSSVLSALQKNHENEVVVLDPFCGCGTTLVSAQEPSKSLNIKAVGIERNPFIHFVAKTKTAWPRMRPENISFPRASRPRRFTVSERKDT